MKQITISLSDYEHLLNCIINQKDINNVAEDKRERFQAAIDDAVDKGMKLLYSQKYNLA